MKEKLKKILPWLVLLLVISSLTTWYLLSRKVSDAERSSYNDKIKNAELSFNAREYSEAINQYYEATAVIPQELTAYQGIVKILLLKNRVDQAVAITRESTRALSSVDRSQLYKMIGDYYYENYDYQEAKDMYQEGLSLGVVNPDAELALGKALMNIGRIEEGRKQIEGNSYDGDSVVEANLVLSYIYALKDIEKAKSQIGSITASGKWNPYYDEFDLVLKTLDDDKKFNATKLARIYLNNNYPYLALNILKTIEGEITEYVEGMYYTGLAYLQTNQHDKAIEYFDKASILGGMEIEIFWGKARANYSKNDLEGAINNYTKAIEFGGKDAPEELVREYIDILLANKQNLKAADTIKYLLVNQEKAYIYLLGIEVNDQIGERAVVDFYNQQLGKLELTEEEQKEYLYWRVRLAIDDNNISEANVLLEQLLSYDKYNPKYYLLLGMVKMKENDIAEAKSAFEKGVEYDNSNLISEEALKLLSNLK
ncbi:MAG: tetratricopeptide repeat protein [Candidatus Dojkabacteria bacterium]|jgi:predicted negative regulator of RcsB-dependent stress response